MNFYKCFFLRNHILADNQGYLQYITVGKAVLIGLFLSQDSAPEPVSNARATPSTM